ncbi:DUF3298 and DUF4163 domain-containing protein [Clostridium sp. P21]|uniref:DUF3298 and DUF4163 domain-containing protein n=1 Tax=Clostridium muellerianum TaxID=2716538 RepID=A0A7Y0HM06_9CLOT|nr:DUF3298 and DUF4163 domain-containing protein [Clostridium muellerianum]NMM62519.1 DUF3298 and DUF4163 domain-containing protein [Clostridium muellerianum]
MIYFSYPDNWNPSANRYDSYDYKNHTKDYRDFRETVGLKNQKLMPPKFSISYPVIDNPDSKDNITKINNAIVDEVDKLFRSQVLRPEIINFAEVLGTYEITLNKNGILSILFALYVYENKAAHGFTLYSSITANVQKGEVYSFGDLFNPKMYYIPILNELAQKYIKENNILLINKYNGITENQQYYLTENSLVLYYQLYEYTPHSYGLFKIEIPYSKILNIIGPAGPIPKILP